MKGSQKRKLAIGLAVLLLSAGVLSATPITTTKHILKQKENNENIILRFSTNSPTINEEHNNCLFNRNQQKHTISKVEKSISISSEDSKSLINELQKIKNRIETSSSQEEKIRLYSNCLRLFSKYNILPESFTINALLKTTNEMALKLYEQKDSMPSFLKNKIPKKSDLNIVAKNQNYNPMPIVNNVDSGEFRLDLGSVFFVMTLFSEMTPWNIFRLPIGTANATEINITDFTIGQILSDIFPGMEKFTLLIGGIAGLGYAELLSIPGNGIIGGQSLFSWPQAIPLNLFIYCGSSLIIPIAFGTASLTILLDRGPRQVPVPLLDFGIFGSVLTVHMPYSRNPAS